jgi:hypothetical protein
MVDLVPRGFDNHRRNYLRCDQPSKGHGTESSSASVERFPTALPLASLLLHNASVSSTIFVVCHCLSSGRELGMPYRSAINQLNVLDCLCECGHRRGAWNREHDRPHHGGYMSQPHIVCPLCDKPLSGYAVISTHASIFHAGKRFNSVLYWNPQSYDTLVRLRDDEWTGHVGDVGACLHDHCACRAFRGKTRAVQLRASLETLSTSPCSCTQSMSAGRVRACWCALHSIL